MRQMQLRQRVLCAVATLVLMFGACERVREHSVSTTMPNAAVVQDNKRSYTLVEGGLPTDLGTLQLSQLIGPMGGSLTLAGHVLTVPAGAVTEPTLFTLTLGTRGYVEVGLKATREIFGTVVDVGSTGFADG